MKTETALAVEQKRNILLVNENNRFHAVIQELKARVIVSLFV